VVPPAAHTAAHTQQHTQCSTHSAAHTEQHTQCRVQHYSTALQYSTHSAAHTHSSTHRQAHSAAHTMSVASVPSSQVGPCEPWRAVNVQSGCSGREGTVVASPQKLPDSMMPNGCGRVSAASTNIVPIARQSTACVRDASAWEHQMGTREPSQANARVLVRRGAVTQRLHIYASCVSRNRAAGGEAAAGVVGVDRQEAATQAS
jgi:hypothetical protein